MITTERFTVTVGDVGLDGVITKRRLAAMERRARVPLFQLVGLPYACTEAALVECCGVAEDALESTLDTVVISDFVNAFVPGAVKVLMGGPATPIVIAPVRPESGGGAS